ncbi:MAG: ABC transporter substrate-binding protein [Halofilum sp. (in: g-proteobacteria)]|nr:ABC transporter substrate-binding protein [Halofilum sp. (in: g-proteobacteria)]
MRTATFRRAAGLAVALTLAVGAARAEPERQVRIAGSLYLGDLPTVLADQRGFFAAQRLRAAVEYNLSGKRSLARLRAGETDFALMAPTPVVLDRLADPDPGGPDDPVILASLAHSTELTQIVALGGAGIERPADLRGRRIAINRGTSTEFVWWLFEQYHDIDRLSVELVSMTFPEMPDALIAGRVDAVVLLEPWLARLGDRLDRVAGPPLRRFHVEDLYTGKWILVTTPRIARERRGLCIDVLTAYRQAIEFIESAPAEAITAYNDWAQPAERIRVDPRQTLDYDLNLDWALIAVLQQQFQWARSVGYENVGGPVHVLELVEPGPLHDFRPGAVGIPVDPARGGAS